MGESRLEALARDLARGQVSRRTAVQRLFGAVAAVALPGALFADTAFARCPPSRRCGEKCCPRGARCRSGKCKCKSGLKKCDGKCVDVSTDEANCGACGRACPAGKTCVGGQCSGGATTQPVCGDGRAEGSEICDGADLKGATCQSLGFIGGTLACATNCTYDTSGCLSPSCTTDADCPPGPAGDCQKAVCVSGTCGFVADNSDVPADSNPCTNDLCIDGVPSQTNVASGTACGGGFCNGQGACVGCVTAENCPSPTNPCEVRVCNSGTCGFAAANSGQACGSGGTCQAGVCTGCTGEGSACVGSSPGRCSTQGTVVCSNGQAVCNAPQGASANEVGAACTCSPSGSGTKQCSADGTSIVCVCCQNANDCSSGTFCEGTWACVDGACVNTPRNCDDGYSCTNNFCNEALQSCQFTPINAACNDGLFCNGTETCDPTNPNAHPTTGCVAGTPPCPGGICDEDTDQCV